MSYSTFKTKFPERYVRKERETKWPAALATPAQAAIKPIATDCTPQPKREYIRSKALLAACREIPCQNCGRAEKGTVCAAHSNWGVHGKGGHIKADDNCIAALCDRCHVPILDQGSKLSKAERQAMWHAAHVKTINALLRAGLWPENVPIPDLRSFDA